MFSSDLRSKMRSLIDKLASIKKIKCPTKSTTNLNQNEWRTTHSIIPTRTVGEIYQWPSDRRWTKTSFALQFAFRISMFNVSCNSHYLSHFAASFIDVWAEWSTAKNFSIVFFFYDYTIIVSPTVSSSILRDKTNFNTQLLVFETSNFKSSSI